MAEPLDSDIFVLWRRCFVLRSERIAERLLTAPGMRPRAVFLIIMQLYLLRHAIALDRQEFRGKDDGDRPLTKDGRKKMVRAAKGMRKAGLTFDLILSSPLVRARDTADIVAHEFTNRRHLKLTNHLKPGAPQKAFIQQVASFTKAHSVMLVGHEPDLSRLFAVLIGAGSPEALKLKKGALCLLSVEKLRYGRCAKLEWLMTAKQLAALA